MEEIRDRLRKKVELHAIIDSQSSPDRRLIPLILSGSGH